MRGSQYFLAFLYIFAILHNLANSDPHLSRVSSGWTGGNNDGGTSANEQESPAENQLVTWSNNSTGASRATNLHGIPVPSLSASQAIGTRGHLLLQDFVLLEKLGSFNRERIPERVVHAKGTGAHGEFVVTHDISKYTKAKFLNGIGKKTRTFVRFSRSVGQLGSTDTEIDPDGFATKFYTEEGNYDLVGNATENLAIRDPMLFPDINRSRKKNPQTGMKDANMWWDFVSQRPESTLHTIFLFSDIGRSASYRRNNGFGVHAFKCVNGEGKVSFCKFHWRTLQPGPALTFQRAKQLQGTDPEYKTQDLYDAIENGEYPRWNFSMQVMSVEQAINYPVNPFDITRIWRLEDFPLIPVGVMTLSRNPGNVFAEVEQAAFGVSNMVPGIEPSPDRMLTARIFAYQDTQRYRLGVNFAQLPINRPEAQVNSYMRDGQACYGDNGGGSPNYFPNSYGGHYADAVQAAQVAFSVEGIVDRYDVPEDEFRDARLFLERDVDPEHRRRLVESVADWLKEAREDIRERVLSNNFYPVETAFGEEIRREVERQLEERRRENAKNLLHF